MNRLSALLVAILLALIGQRWLTGDGIPRDSLILFIVAGVIFAAASVAPLSWPRLPGRRKWMYYGIALAGAAVLLVTAALPQFWRGNFGGLGFWLWLLAIPLFAVGIWLDCPSPDVEGEQEAEQSWKTDRIDRRWLLVLLVLILLVAGAARFYQLGVYPNGCQSDECNNGLDALKWLNGAPYTPYAETNEGQATLFTYVIALFIKLFGQNVQTMRMVSAFMGTLTVLAFFFLAQELYGQRLALLTAALVAADRWHITFSRIVYELIMMPLALALQTLFLVKALKTGRRRWWGLAGLMLALGMNTYTAYRVVPAFVAVYFVYWLVTHRQRLVRDLEGMVVFAAGVFVGMAPMGVYIIRNWNVFISRINHISVFNDVQAAGSYEPLFSNLRKSLYMFNWQGDFAALNNLPGAPLLQFVVAVLLVLGLAWAIRWFWKELPAFYLLWFVAVTSLAVLSVAHEAPTARRPIGLVPVIYLLVGAVFQQLWWAWDRAWGVKRWRPLAIGLTAVVVFVAASNINTYFRVQAVSPDVWGAYSPNESGVGEYLATVPAELPIYMTPQYTHHSAVKFIGGPHDIKILSLAQDVPLREDPGGDVEYILEPVDERLVPLLQQLYPGGEYKLHNDRFGRPLFISYHVPRAALDAARGLQAAFAPGSGNESVPPVPGPQVRSLDLNLSAATPLPPPFTAQYTGALLVPGYGDYTLELSSEGGEATLFLDEEEVLRVKGEPDGSRGVQQVQRTLPGGFQGLRLTYTSGDTPGRVQVRWGSTQNPELAPIDPALLYTLPGASNGLVGYYYATPDWSGTPSLIQRDLFILPNNSLREPYSIKWVGKVAAPTAGPYVFGTRSDDGSLVYVDGQLVVDNSGSHGSEYREGVINLEQGFHDIEVRYNELGGSRDMQLWWQPPNGPKAIVPSAYLFPAEKNLPQGLVLPPPPTLAPSLVQVSPETGEVVVPETGPGRPETEQGAPAQPAQAPASSGPTLPVGDFPTTQPAVVWTYGACGTGQEQLQRPMGVAAGANGDVYVADTANQRLVHLDKDGKFVNAWGQAGEGPGQFTEPFDVGVTPDGNVAVLDAVNQVISVWTPAGDLVNTLGQQLTFYRPRGFGISPAGEYFVADTGGVRVVQAGADGQRINQFGGPEEDLGPGQPTDAAVSPGGFAYVAEPISGLLWRLDPATGERQKFAGVAANTVESPHLAVGSDGRILLSDPEGGRVLALTPDVKPLAQFGGRGSQPGQFGRPVGVAFGPGGTMFVVDPDLCRVTAFSALP